MKPEGSTPASLLSTTTGLLGLRLLVRARERVRERFRERAVGCEPVDIMKMPQFGVLKGLSVRRGKAGWLRIVMVVMMITMTMTMMMMMVDDG